MARIRSTIIEYKRKNRELPNLDKRIDEFVFIKV
jgi:hypothetical protein